ncbi:MAG TPA: plastocyanin/azurin family copper-binding protein [Thermoleophilia bacterium]|nr:plastocyanin/azurin family copper-binding protein [Thermoleophilia bacterium]
MRTLRTVPVVSATVVAIAALLVVAGCGSSTGGGSTQTNTPTAPAVGGAAVTIEDFAFAPQTLTVKTSTTVTWTNNDAAPHTVASTDSISTDAKTTGMFESGSLGKGDTFSFTFTKPGTYFYVCTLHAGEPAMHGEIVVSDSA